MQSVIQRCELTASEATACKEKLYTLGGVYINAGMKAVVFEYRLAALAAANVEEDYTMICFMYYLQARSMPVQLWLIYVTKFSRIDKWI